jgi:hypothetical protein
VEIRFVDDLKELAKIMKVSPENRIDELVKEIKSPNEGEQ